MLDILCIGDAKIDIFLNIPDDDPHFNLDSSKEHLLLDFGQKINVKDYKKDIGGNAANTAVGLTKLGKNVGLCAEIGTDEFSNFLIKTLEKENLNTNFLKQDENKPTSFSVCINYKSERTILSEHVERTHSFNFLHTTAPFIYLTSLGEEWKSPYEQALKLIKNKEIKLAFNPGTLQIEDRGKLVMDLIEMSDYLFVNKEEAESLLYGKDSGLSDEKKEIKKILFGLKSLGAKNIIITDSEKGSFAMDEYSKYFQLEAIKVDVVEKTGAGDAFNAGFIAAILENKNIQEALVWGSLDASFVIQQVGAQKGLLKKEGMIDNLGRIGSYKTSPL
ncbi:MAG: hypothetical protein A3B38_03930 [Candidatus Levybacteria bacterium RIFCSPLOWO2_01_FULL_36_13]|nr:MAG: hypothetical protein A2684_00865 [Candidatus Levybacteria bacterium RIFCSPHIGHO2_01_FULL_36_15b]OGH34279.1 MAG: hypothetical protein A3B38_03930 [Candidatus Levybacteria bacterium RIFCSPLOWO2_01_FULL_36_13]